MIWEQLQHPNLVQLLDVFETDECLYLVTELMRGGDLFKKLEKANTFSEVVAARLARQIVSAVSDMPTSLHVYNLILAWPRDRLPLFPHASALVYDFGNLVQ